MTLSTPEELAALQRVGQVVASAIQAMLDAIEPGITTAELDDIGAAVLDAAGARSAPRVTYNFPGATCISVNEEVAHGIPGGRVIQAGDLVNVDVSAELDGFYADSGATFAVPPVSELDRRLCEATQGALEAGLRAARAGARLSAVGRAMEQHARQAGFRVIRNLCSHGIGRSLHEEPQEILGFYEPAESRVLHEGLVITLEPFLTTGRSMVREGRDGWTLLNSAGSRNAQFEHTFVVTRDAPIILTARA